jgi:EpsI family protein
VIARAYLAAAVLLVSGLVFSRSLHAEAPPPRTAFAAFPRSVGPWTMVRSDPFTPDVLKVLAADDYMNRLYTAGAQRAAFIYAGYYVSQRQGDTIHSPLNCLPGSGWEVAEKSRATLDVGGGRTAEVNDFIIERGIERQAVVYWYQSHGRIIASEYWGKTFLVWDAMRMNRSDGSLVRVIVPAGTGDAGVVAAARADARAFAARVVPMLSTYIPN